MELICVSGDIMFSTAYGKVPLSAAIYVQR